MRIPISTREGIHKQGDFWCAMSGKGRVHGAGSSPNAVFIRGHERRKRVTSPSKSQGALLPGMIKRTWTGLGAREKQAWIDKCKGVLGDLEVQVKEDRGRSPFSMASAPLAPAGPEVPARVEASSSSATATTNTKEQSPPSANLRPRASTSRQEVGVSFSVHRVEFDMWLRSASPRAA